MLLAGGDDVVRRLVLLQHQVHGADEVAGVAPVAERVEVAEPEVVLQAQRDAGDCARDLARDEGLAAHRALVIEEDAVAGVHAVGLAVVHRDPVAVHLGGAVRAAWVEGRGLALRHLLHLPEHLAGGGLVEAGALGDAEDAHRLEQAERAEGVAVGRVLRRLEADLHVALGGEVVDLVRLGLLHDADEVGGVGEVAVVHEEAAAGHVRIRVEVVDAVGVEGAGAALDAVDGVALAEQELGQVGAVLAGDAGDERRLRHLFSRYRLVRRCGEGRPRARPWAPSRRPLRRPTSMSLRGVPSGLEASHSTGPS